MESRDGKVGILLLDFHFSSRSPPGLWECGNRDSDFQGLWETRETCFWFSSFSIARHFHSPFVAVIFHALCLRSKLANSFCFSFCILRAAVVSLLLAAFRFSSSTVSSGFKCRARSGSCRKISHGVAYQG